MPWSGSITLTMVWTMEGGVKNSPSSCARRFENSARKHSLMRPNTSPEAVRSASESKVRIISSRTSFSNCVQSFGNCPASGGKRSSTASIAGGDVSTESAVLRHLRQHVIACCLGQRQGTAAGEIGLDAREVRRSASGLVGFDRLQRRVAEVRRMPQEDQARDGHEVLVRREVRVGPQVVCDLPEFRAELLDAGKVVRDHCSAVSPGFLSIEGALVPYGASGRSCSWIPGTTTGH